MAATDDVQATVLEVLSGIAPEIDPKSVPPEANLRRELDLDSIDFQNFLIGLAKAFAIDIPERDAAACATLAGCVAYLRRPPSQP